MRFSTDNSLSSNKETVNRDLGDGLRLIWSNTTKFNKNFYFDLSYIYSHKNKDSYKNSEGLHIESLEEETEITLHEGEITLGYSTVAAYKPGSMVPPYEIELGYRKSLAGRNVPYANIFLLNMWVYF